MVFYAPPGAGKTSLGFTADAPLLLDFDHGAYRSQFRGDTVQIENWDAVDQMSAQDLSAYRTVVVDTAGRALDALTTALIGKNPKLKGYGGALSLQGYGALKTAFVGWLKLLHSFGKDVVLLSHMDEQRSGDEIVERLDVQGGSKGEIYKCADAMARLQIAAGGKRVLNFNPSDTAYGKNPAQLPVLPVPDYKQEPQFLAGVIADIKQKLNASSEAGLAELVRMNELRESFEFYTDAAQFSAKAIELAQKKAPAADKALLIAVAKTKGFKFDTKVKGFIAVEAANA
jgi:hypothetical protein